jgi:hypothetical protein
MSSIIECIKEEINIRRQNLITKRQVQIAENNKEEETLNLWENSLRRLEKEEE